MLILIGSFCVGIVFVTPSTLIACNFLPLLSITMELRNAALHCVFKALMTHTEFKMGNHLISLRMRVVHGNIVSVLNYERRHERVEVEPHFYLGAV